METSLTEEERAVLKAAYYRPLVAKARQTKAERVQRGLPNYRPPLGYKLVEQGKEQRVVVDMKTAPYIREAFRLAAQGVSLRRILAELTDKGMRTVRREEMSPTALWKILRNQFYVGNVQTRGVWQPGSHRTLIGMEVFKQVQLMCKERENSHA